MKSYGGASLAKLFFTLADCLDAGGDCGINCLRFLTPKEADSTLMLSMTGEGGGGMDGRDVGFELRLLGHDSIVDVDCDDIGNECFFAVPLFDFGEDAKSIGPPLIEICFPPFPRAFDD